MNSIPKNAMNWDLLKVCCCCLNEGCSKNIYTEYFRSGQKEVYNDILEETFGIQITKSNSAAGECLICEECITQLCISSTFRNMVLKSQKTMQEYKKQSCSTDEKLDTSTIEVPIKMEMLPVEDPEHNTIGDDGGSVSDDGEFTEFYSESGYNVIEGKEILADIKLEMRSSAALADSKLRAKRKSREHTTKLKKCKIKSEERFTNETRKDWSKIIERRGNGPILRENSLKLLANSTICVFQYNKSRYRCFCCKEPFSDLASLKDHTNADHRLVDIEKKIILQQNRLVKVEVSVIICKLCPKQVDTLAELRQHLKEHGLSFVTEEDLLVPFKINGQLQCQICSEPFSVFRLLNIHMNKHFQKQVCHICGTGFSNLVFLNLHKTRSHRPLKCKQCDVIFTSKSEKRNHDVSLHGMKIERKLRFPCPYCQERFFQENFRVQHLVDKHGMKKPEHKCSVCPKVFITRSLCNNHLKNVHLKEKNHECDVCHNFFYTKSDVVRHRVTHTGEKKFSCLICNSPFATKDSLRRHLKRTHGGVN